MRISDLNEQVGYILLTYPDGKRFYIQTSFDSNLCPSPKYKHVFDMLTGKNIPKRILENSSYKVYALEPLEFREESNFLKQFM